MAIDWESTLRSWAKPPSDNEDAKRDRTEKEIKAALAASGVLSGIDYKVYAKGSYANNTNVRLDYDVDVAVECKEFAYFSTSGGPGDIQEKSLVATAGTYKGGYTSTEFKADVEAALVKFYGRAAVSRGNMAMRVREKKTTLPADVVPCFEYHQRYDLDHLGSPIYHLGTRVYKGDTGRYINNWPTQQKANGVDKNELTGRRYKKMVRALKRLENWLVHDGIIDELPSFLMECLVYNVPNSAFDHLNYVDDMRGVLAWTFDKTLQYDSCRHWKEVSERKLLFGKHQKWNLADAHGLASAGWNYMGFE